MHRIGKGHYRHKGIDIQRQSDGWAADYYTWTLYAPTLAKMGKEIESEDRLMDQWWNKGGSDGKN